ncbi:MAG: hypothetical protein WCD76_12620 [Pyrinomonadaceae bacterium]
MSNESRRLKPAQIEADKSSFAALQAITNYAPANPDYSTAAIAKAQTDLTNAQAVEAQAQAAYAAARDDAVACEWGLHNRILGAKDQVTAQFGRNSNEVQALGLKKKMERKAPQRRTKKDGTK